MDTLDFNDKYSGPFEGKKYTSDDWLDAKERLELSSEANNKLLARQYMAFLKSLEDFQDYPILGE